MIITHYLLFRGRRRSSRKSLGLEDEVDLKVPPFGKCPDNDDYDHDKYDVNDMMNHH